MERGFQIPQIGTKKALLIEKNMPAEGMMKVLKQAEEDRKNGSVVTIAVMKKNKKFQKEQVAKAAKVYSGQLRREVNEEREKLGKKPIEDEDDENHPQGVEAHRKPQKRLFPPQTRTAECS